MNTYEKYDSDRYVCRGCVMWISGQGDSSSLSISFLCWDKNLEKFVRFYPKKDIGLNEAFSLFKRLELVIGKNVNDIDVNDDDYFNLM